MLEIGAVIFCGCLLMFGTDALLLDTAALVGVDDMLPLRGRLLTWLGFEYSSSFSANSGDM